ncbi:MAG: DivIVA domain-containing protein [bacterium]|nr:DivIVA domain-containing protein [bacterium]
MKLTPLDIRKQEFTKSLRGYNIEEVRAFLETVADQFDLVQKRATDFSEKVVQLETRLSDFQMIEKSLQETLLKAEENSRRSKDDSLREADITMREAELKAQQLIMDAHGELERLKSEILLIRSRRDAFVKNLKYLIQNQIELIEIIEANDFSPDVAINRERHDDDPRTVS